MVFVVLPWLPVYGGMGIDNHAMGRLTDLILDGRVHDAVFGSDFEQ